MPTPAKPYAVLSGEKKSHRTKAELNQRKQAEKSLSSDKKIGERQEVKDNKVAHKEFNRIKKLLEKIEKDDAFYEPVINRYCMIHAECREIEERREAFGKLIKDFEKQIDTIPKEDRVAFMDELVRISNNIAKLAGQMNTCDKLLQQKRKMLFDIEKENIMTIAAALRTIPKNTEKKTNPLLEALGG